MVGVLLLLVKVVESFKGVRGRSVGVEWVPVGDETSGKGYPSDIDKSLKCIDLNMPLTNENIDRRN